MKSNMTNKHN